MSSEHIEVKDAPARTEQADLYTSSNSQESIQEKDHTLFQRRHTGEEESDLAVLEEKKNDGLEQQDVDRDEEKKVFGMRQKLFTLVWHGVAWLLFTGNTMMMTMKMVMGMRRIDVDVIQQ